MFSFTGFTSQKTEFGGSQTGGKQCEKSKID